MKTMNAKKARALRRLARQSPLHAETAADVAYKDTASVTILPQVRESRRIGKPVQFLGQKQLAADCIRASYKRIKKFATAKPIGREIASAAIRMYRREAALNAS